MNDDIRFERLFADGLHDSAPRHAPDRLRTSIKAQTGEMRPRARWLALIKEPTMRNNNRLAVGSPTARVAAIMAATLLTAAMVIGAGIAGTQLLAADGPIIVDQSGDGDHSTVQAAVDAAQDGDEVLVRPGTYAERILIKKDITVRGDGPVQGIVLEMDIGELITLTETEAEVVNLTLRGGNNTQGMQIFGGAPTVRGLVFDGVGTPNGSEQLGAGGSLAIMGGTAKVLDSRFVDGGEIKVDLGADVVIEGNDFIDGPHLYLRDPGDETIVRGNTFSGTFDRAMGLFGMSTMIIEGNTVEGAGGDGITIGGWYGTAPGHDPIIRDNEISSTSVGINAVADSAPVVEGNRLRDNATGILSSSDVSSFVDNELSGNDIGMQLTGSPMLDGNSIEDGRVGILVVGEGTKPEMKGNTVCGNEENVQISDSTSASTLTYDDTNQVC